MKYIIPILLIASSMISYGQNKKEILLGIQPGITKEQYYEKNDFDLNIIPFVIQFPIFDRTELRVLTIYNQHFGNSNEISDLGMQVSLPFYLNHNQNTIELNHGFYVGPGLGLGRNLREDKYSTSLWIEPGYTFESNNAFYISLSMQFGATHFFYDNQSNAWVNHLALIKVNLGFVLNKNVKN